MVASYAEALMGPLSLSGSTDHIITLKDYFLLVLHT